MDGSPRARRQTRAADPDKKPVGRPSEYDPAYCGRVLEYGRAGKSKAYIAAHLGVRRQTLDNWADAHPEFLDALTRARDLAQAWWEDAGQSGMQTSGFNGSVWSRSMAARFPDDWREKKDIHHTGGLDHSSLTAEEIDARINELLAEHGLEVASDFGADGDAEPVGGEGEAD